MALYTNGSGTPTSPGQQDAGKHRRLLNRLLRDLVAFTGTAITDIVNKPKTPRQSKKRRLLYRSPSDLTDRDLDALVTVIGIERWWAAFERATHPQEWKPTRIEDADDFEDALHGISLDFFGHAEDGSDWIVDQVLAAFRHFDPDFTEPPESVMVEVRSAAAKIVADIFTGENDNVCATFEIADLIRSAEH